MLKLFVMLFFSALLSAQTWVEERTFVREGIASPRIGGLVTGPLTKKLGGFLWFQVEKGYSQSYGGITFSPKPWLQLAVGPGLEQAESPLRVGGFVWMGEGKNSLLFIPEYGGSEFWWKLEASRKITNAVSAGLLTERFKGTGPRFEYRIPKTPLAIWAAPMFDRSPDTRSIRVNALIGLRWNL